MAIKISLPKPPSVNHIYGYTSRGNYARSYITKQGRDWFDQSALIVKANIFKKDYFLKEDKVRVDINLYTAYRNDVDNIVKPILDLLSSHTGVIPNDIQIFKLTTEKFKVGKKNEKVDVTISYY